MLNKLLHKDHYQIVKNQPYVSKPPMLAPLKRKVKFTRSLEKKIMDNKPLIIMILVLLIFLLMI
jgi:hypothetical protein